MFRFFRELLGSMTIPHRSAVRPVLRVTAEEVLVRPCDEELTRFRWDEVEEIATFKRDFGLYDDVR